MELLYKLQPDGRWPIYDQILVAAFIDDSIITKRELRKVRNCGSDLLKLIQPSLSLQKASIILEGSKEERGKVNLNPPTEDETFEADFLLGFDEEKLRNVITDGIL